MLKFINFLFNTLRICIKFKNVQKVNGSDILSSLLYYGRKLKFSLTMFPIIKTIIEMYK